MSRQTIIITDDDIAYAESILLHEGQDFDEERRAFIKNLETIDLQAVPGSGKTTALLAKLLVLERHLPIEDGSGILVLSHTNSAIEEIRRRIGNSCPKLLSYPNFVGTIQSFVDQFLAIPYFACRWQKRPYAIDGDMYSERALRFARFNPHGFSPQDHKNARYFLNLKGIATTYRLGINIQTTVILNGIGGTRLDFTKPRGRTKPENYVDFSEVEKIQIEKWLVKFKQHILVDDGVLHFDDAYFLAARCLTRYPCVKTLLQRRFQFVFVDEMQDMDHHQYRLLEDIFYEGGKNGCAYQRIGDKNQAIYSHDVKIDEIWTDRDTVLRLTGSQRLSSRVAEVVTPFATSRTPIEGRNAPNGAGTDNDLLPHVIVFDDDSRCDVIPKFCELIKANISAGKIPSNLEHPIKALAWVKDERGLTEYWGAYQPEAVKSKTVHANLRSYVTFARQEDWRVYGLGPIHKKITDGLLRVLHMEGVRNPDSKSGYFSTRSFHTYLRETNSELHDALRLKCLYWSRGVYAGKVDQAYDDIKEFIPSLLGAFGRQLTNAVEFVGGEPPAAASDDADAGESPRGRVNMYRCPKTGIDVHVGTVHSAKGETHTATLYLESYYHNDGGKSYESRRLRDQFKGEPLSPGAGKRVKQSARMVYVGFSRPTHLLCFAVHKDRFDKVAFPTSRWAIETVC